jgi:hypothetical protein
MTDFLLSIALGGIFGDILCACILKRWGAGSVLAALALMVLFAAWGVRA